jgi:hypothetical protein
MSAVAIPIDESSAADARLVRQIVQPGLLGLMDGSVSTLAPLFAAANLTGSPRAAFFVGVATAVGAGISMGFAEALSDDGKVSLRGKSWMRKSDHRHRGTAMSVAYVVVVVELIAIAYIRYRYMRSALWRTVVQVIVGGAIVFFIGLWLGRYAAGG